MSIAVNSETEHLHLASAASFVCCFVLSVSAVWAVTEQCRTLFSVAYIFR